MLQDVVYKDSEGLTWLVRVNEGTPPELYSSGIRIGPPDLSSLKLNEKDSKKLQEALVKARLVNAELIKGNAEALLRAISSVMPVRDAKAVREQIKSIYQQEYYIEER